MRALSSPLRLLGCLCLALLLAACGDDSKPQKAEAPPPAPDCSCPGTPPPEQKPSLTLTAASFADLPGWGDDAIEEALPAIQRSCKRLLTQADTATVGPKGRAGTVADWRRACLALDQAGGDPAALRTALEKAFRPYLAADNGKAEGFFTGYYEAEVTGSLTRQGAYVWPLYRAPADLVRIRLGSFRADLEGETLFGRLQGQDLVPYYDRGEIDEGHALAGRGLELVWLDDYVQLFFLQVQGSGQVTLPDGRRLRVGYAGNNGHPFTAIGRLLLDEGKIDRGQATAQGVVEWLKSHPAEAWPMMKRNARYVFFREIDGEGPLGAQGVALTAGRSLAVDTAFLPLGAPLWLDTTWPGSDRPLRRLVVAQDVGGAIKGPVRGDLFWGTGAAALEQAGRMKQPGRYWLLLPATVTP